MNRTLKHYLNPRCIEYISISHIGYKRTLLKIHVQCNLSNAFDHLIFIQFLTKNLFKYSKYLQRTLYSLQVRISIRSIYWEGAELELVLKAVTWIARSQTNGYTDLSVVFSVADPFVLIVGCWRRI